MTYQTQNTGSLSCALKTLLRRPLVGVAGLGALLPLAALANPTGGQVVGGQATINNPNANNTVVNQASQNAIINWQQFSIGSGQYVQFVQPDSSSVILNRVIGGNPSSILGTMKANGQVFLVNPNGVFFGAGASLDVQGLVASTLDIKNSDFMAGHYVFSKATGSADGSVINAGAINANANGYVVLAGDYAENDGIIAAQTGHVVLASGTHATLTLSGDSLLSFAVDQATLANLAGVSNTGTITADGGTVVMTADVANELKATVVNNTGLVEAHSISAQGGSIYFTAAGGDIENSGTLDASATDTGVAGGSIVLKGDAKTDLTSTSKVIATGDNAKGGSLEISGHDIRVRGTRKVGAGGHILYDPATVTINSGAGGGTNTFGTGSIDSTLNAGASVNIAASTSVVKGTATNITATAGAGALTITAGSGGIKLSGLTINIKGNLTASASSGPVSMGQISAGVVTLKGASVTDSGNIVATGAVGITASNGNVVVQGISAAGNVDVTVHDSSGGGGGIDVNGNITTTGAGHHVKLTATNSSGNGAHVDVTGSLDATGSVSVSANNAGSGNGGNVSLHNVTAGGNVDVTASNTGSGSGGKVTVNGNITTTGTGHVKLTASNHASSSKGGSVDVTGSINAAGSVSVSAKNLGSSVTGGFITLGSVTGLKINLHAQNNATSSGGSITVNGNLHATGTAATDGITLLAQDNGYSGSHGEHIKVTGSVIADHGPVSITASNSHNGAQISVGAVGGTAIDIVAKGDTSSSGNNQTTIKTGALTATGTSAGTAHVKVTASGSSNGGAEATVQTGDISAMGDVNIGGGGGLTVGHILNAGTATLSAGTHTLTLARGDSSSPTLKTTSANPVTITAGHVAFGGTGGIYISVGGNFTLSSSIGSNSTTGHFSGDVTLKAGGTLDIERSIYAGSKSSSHKISAEGNSGLKVGTSGNPVNLIAGGDIILKADGGSASIGGTAAGKIQIEAGIDAGATSRDLSIDNSGGSLTIQAGGGSLTGSGSVDHSITLSAGGNVTLSASNSMTIAAGDNLTGSVTASAAGDNKHATIDADVTIHATGDLTLNAGGDLTVRGGNDPHGSVRASNSTYSNASLGLTLSAKTTLTAGGNMSLAGANGVTIEGGSEAGDSASISANAANDKLAFTATNGVNVNAAGNITINASAGSMHMHGGNDAGGSMHINLGSHAASASATIDVNSHLAITAGSMLTVAASSNVYVSPGSDAVNSINLAVQGAKATVNFTASGGAALKAASASFNAGSEVLFYADESPARYDDVTIGGQSASATITVNANNDITTTAGNLTIVGGTEVGLYGGGYEVGYNNDLIASGQKASITFKVDNHNSVSVAGNVTITAGNSTSGDFSMYSGQYYALYGMTAKASGTSAAVDFSLNGNNQVTAGGAITVTAGSSISLKTSGDVAISIASIAATGSHAAVNVSDTGGNRLTANDGSITLNALTGNLGISGASGDYYNYDIKASAASASAKLNVLVPTVLTANGGNINLSAGGDISLGGGNYPGYSNSVIAIGANATAASSGDMRVMLTANSGNINLTAGSYVDISAGEEAGYSVLLTASGSGAKATVTDQASMSLTAGGDVLLNAGTYFDVKGSNSAAIYASVTAKGAGAKANLTADDSVTINAGGNLTLNAGANYMDIYGGDYPAYEVVTHASSGGSLNVTAKAGVTLTAGGAFTASIASGDMSIYAGYEAGYSASIGTSTSPISHGKATVTGDAGVTITAGTNITLNAPTSSLEIYGYESAGRDAKVFAGSSGTANLTVKENVVINAGGNFTVSAGSELEIYGYYGPAESASVTAKNGMANLTALSNVTITTGGDVTLTAGTYMELYGSEDAGSEAKIHASSGGSANLTAKSNLVIDAGGAFTATAGTYLDVYGSGYGAQNASVTASGAGAKANLTADGSVSITAGTGLTLIATGSSVSIHGGSHAGENMTAHAGSSGMVNVNLNSSAVFAAGSGGISVQAGTDLDIHAGDNMSISFTSGGAGKLTANVDASVTLKTTSGGNITLSAGKVGAGSLSIHGGTGASVNVSGSNAAAKQTVTVLDGVSINAAGNLNLTNNSGDIKISGGSGSVTLGKAGTNTVSFDQSAILQAGGDVAITATGSLSVLAAPFTDLHVYGSTAGAVNTATVTGHAKVVAVNDLTLNVGGNMLVQGGSATYATVGSSHSSKGAGHLTLNDYADAVMSAGRDIVIKNIGGNFTVQGPSSGQYVYAEAFGGTSHAVTVAYEENNATLSAGRDIVTASGGSIAGSMTVRGAYYGSAYAGDQGQNSATAHADTTISAGRNIDLKVGGDLNVTAAWDEASGSAYASTAAATAKVIDTTNTMIIATGNLTIDAGGSINIHGASDANASAYNAGLKNSVSVQSKVTLSAGSNLLLNAANGMSIAGADSVDGEAKASGAGANNHASVDASVTLNATGNIQLIAGGNVTVRGGNDPHGSLKASGSSATPSPHTVYYSNASLGVTLKAVTTLTAGGNLNVTGSAVNVSGGASAGKSTKVLGRASKDVMTFTASNGVALNATGTLGISATVGSIAVHGGSAAGSKAVITAKNGGTATVTTNSDVNVTGGTVLLKAATNIDVAQGVAAATPATLSSSAGGVATLTTSTKAVVTGSAMNLTAVSNVNWSSGGTLIVGNGSLSSVTADPAAQFMGIAAGVSPSLKIVANGAVNVGTTTMTGDYIYIQAGSINSAGAALSLPANTVLQLVPTVATATVGVSGTTGSAGTLDVNYQFTSALPFGVKNLIIGATGVTTGDITVGQAAALDLSGDNVAFVTGGNILSTNLVTADKVVYAAGGNVTGVSKTASVAVAYASNVSLDNSAYTGAANLAFGSGTFGNVTASFGGAGNLTTGIKATSLTLTAPGALNLGSGAITLTGAASLSGKGVSNTGLLTAASVAAAAGTGTINLVTQTGSLTFSSGTSATVDDTAETGAVSVNASGVADASLTLKTTSVTLNSGTNVTLDDTAETGAATLAFGSGTFGNVAASFGGAGNLTTGIKATSLTLTAPGALGLGAGTITLTGVADLTGKGVSGTGLLTAASVTAAAGTGAIDLVTQTGSLTLRSGVSANIDDTAFTGAVTVNGGQVADATMLLKTTALTLTGGKNVTLDDTAETSTTTFTGNGSLGNVVAGFGGSVGLNGNLTATSLVITTPGNITDATSTYKLGAAEFTAGGNIDLHDMNLTIGSGTIAGVTGDSKLNALLGIVHLAPTSAVPNGVFTAGKGKSITLGNLTLTGSYLQLNADAFTFSGTVTAPSGSVVQLAPVTTGASISIEQTAAKLGTINFNAGQLTLFPTVVIGGQNETGNATIGMNGPIQLNSTNLFVITTGTVKGLNLLQSSGIVGDLTTIIYPGGGFQVPTAAEIMGFNRVFGFEYPPIVMYGEGAYDSAGEGVDFSDPFLAPCLVVVASEDQKSYKCVSGD